MWWPKYQLFPNHLGHISTPFHSHIIYRTSALSLSEMHILILRYIYIYLYIGATICLLNKIRLLEAFCEHFEVTPLTSLLIRNSQYISSQISMLARSFQFSSRPGGGSLVAVLWLSILANSTKQTWNKIEIETSL